MIPSEMTTRLLKDSPGQQLEMPSVRRNIGAGGEKRLTLSFFSSFQLLRLPPRIGEPACARKPLVVGMAVMFRSG